MRSRNNDIDDQIAPHNRVLSKFVVLGNPGQHVSHRNSVLIFSGCCGNKVTVNPTFTHATKKYDVHATEVLLQDVRKEGKQLL